MHRTRVAAAAALLSLPLAAHPATTLYLNASGGTYAPGYPDDSRTDTSSLVRATAVVPAFSCGTGAWADLLACVGRVLAPFDVLLTDVDPGSSPHFELVLGGRPAALGLDAGVGAISPFSCAVVPNAISFVFAESYGCGADALRQLCWVTAQEIGHVHGLDNELLCADPMTYLDGCGEKRFQDVDAPCGEYAARTCCDGSATQNSHRRLLAEIGARPSEGSGGCVTSGGAGLLSIGALAMALVRGHRDRHRA